MPTQSSYGRRPPSSPAPLRDTPRGLLKKDWPFAARALPGSGQGRACCAVAATRPESFRPGARARQPVGPLMRRRAMPCNELLIGQIPKVEIEVVHPPIVAATTGPLGDAASGDKHVYHADHIDCRDLLERAPRVEPDCIWRHPEAIEPDALAVHCAQLGRCRATAGKEPDGLTLGLDQP